MQQAPVRVPQYVITLTQTHQKNEHQPETSSKCHQSAASFDWLALAHNAKARPGTVTDLLPAGTPTRAKWINKVPQLEHQFEQQLTQPEQSPTMNYVSR